ncbi:MAG: hypothetical protein WCK80_00105 [bacterium]
MSEILHRVYEHSDAAKSKIAVGLAMVAVAATVPATAEAGSATSDYNGVAGIFHQHVGYNRATGEANCTIDLDTYDSQRKSFITILRVLKYQKGKWLQDNKFPEVDKFVSYKDNTTHVSATSKAHYNKATVKKEAAKYPIRLSCEHGEGGISVGL